VPMTFRGPGRACLARVVGPPSPSLPRMLLALAGASVSAFALAWSAGPAQALPPPIDGGPFPEPVRRAWLEGRLRPARHAGAATAPAAPAGVIDEPPDGGGASAIRALAATGRWHVPVLLVDFPDRPSTHPAGAFRTLLFDTTGAVPSGSMARYFDEVSGGQLLVRGQVFGWRTLPDTANFYANDSYGLATTTFPQNAAGLLYAAVKEFDPDVDFSQYDRNGDGFVDALLLLHAGVGAEAAASDRTQFWSVTSGLLGNWGFTGSYVTQDPRPGFPGQFMKIDQFSILAEWSPINPPQISEIGVWCHEFGHDLGWPDLYDATTLGGGANLGTGNWCLMSTGAYGGDNRTPSRPTHPCAWAKLDAGWVTQENLVADGDHTFHPIETSRRAYRLWYQGEDSDEFFLLENRQRLGFDAGLPGEGLIVTRIRRDVIAQRRAANNINSGLVPGLRLEEADGRYDLLRSGNRGDSRDPFPGSQNRLRFADDTTPSTRTLDGRPLNTSLEALRAKGDDVSAYVQLSAAGWSAPRSVGTVGPSGALVSNGRPAMIADPAGDLWLAYEDDAPTGTEIFLRRKRFGIDWGVPIPFTSEPGLSLSPTLVQSRTGRKAIAWWDTRDGNSEIYYAWGPPDGGFGPPLRVTRQAAPSQLPAAAWLVDGRLALAWMDGRADGTCIFARIFAPGFENASSDVQASFPEPLVELGNAAVPTIATAGNRVIIAYQERIGGVDEVKACVDSAGRFTATRFLSVRDGFTSNQPVLVGESDTSVWLFWRENGPQTSEIRQARWSVSIGWDLGYDVYRSALNLDLPRPAIDGQKNLHLLFRRSTATGPELVEAAFHQSGRVWDAGPSRLVTFGNEQVTGTAYGFDPFGRTHVVWLGVTPGERRLREIVRAAPASSPVAVDPGDPKGPGVALVSAWPNPARGSAVLRLRTAAARPPGTRALLYSVAGRRLAALDAVGDGDGALSWDGLDEAGRRAPPGLVLVRVVDAGGATVAAGRFVWIP
jgi:immune inhibitor A